MVNPEQQELLRRLTLNDEETVALVMNGRLPVRPLLDHKTTALARLASLAAQEAETASYQSVVDMARAAGADDREIVETVLVVASLIGTARVEASRGPLGDALGANHAVI
jgi:alkylhydroperoxidase/carboxymuconolactone decarboxylase family protein YurZ